jgi:hypothetical protein
MYNDKDSDRILIARMGGEGWGATVYSRQIGNALVFWHEGSSMGEILSGRDPPIVCALVQGSL